MADKPLARLVGEIGFNIDTKAMDRFLAQMNQASKQMTALGRQIDQLSKKSLKLNATLDTTQLTKQINQANKQISQKLGISGAGGSATTDRAVAQQLRLEKLTAQARRETFKAELAQSKLSFANKREDVALATATTRQLQQQAVLQAKQAQASAAESKARLGAARVEDYLVQAKTKQARLEALLTTARSKAAAAGTQELRQQTLLQRTQLGLATARENERRREVAHNQRQEDRRSRMARSEQGQERQRERFRFAAERHTAWQARQVELAERKAAGGDGFGLSGMMGALGRSGLPMAGLAAGGVIAGVQQLLSMASQRVQERQQGADDAQQMSNVFAAAAGQDPGKADDIQKRFLEFSQKYGSEVSIDSAKDYRNFLLKQRGQGRTLEQAQQLYETQTAAFRGAGMTAEESRRANLQLTQVRTKGYSDREDLNTFSEAAPILRGYVERAWAERNKFKGSAEQRSAAVTASTSKGNLKAADFNRAIELYFAENQATINRQAQSIQANNQRLLNDQVIQAANINSNPALIDSVNDNIKAHRELTSAMEPLKTRMMEFDTGLTNIVAGFTRRLAETLDPKKATPEGMANAVDAGLGGNGGINPADINAPAANENDFSRDPVDMFWRWVLGKPQAGAGFETGIAPSSTMSLTPIAPTSSSEFSMGLKQMNEFMTAEKDRQRSMIQAPTVNTNNVTIGDATYNITLPNITALDQGAVEQTVRAIGEKVQQEREAAWKAGLSTDKTPR